MGVIGWQQTTYCSTDANWNSKEESYARPRRLHLPPPQVAERQRECRLITTCIDSPAGAATGAG